MQIKLRLFSSSMECDARAFSFNRDAVNKSECHTALSAQNQVCIEGSRVKFGRYDWQRSSELSLTASKRCESENFCFHVCPWVWIRCCFSMETVEVELHITLLTLLIFEHVRSIESNRSCLVGDTRLQFTVHFTEDRLLRRTLMSENTDTGHCD